MYYFQNFLKRTRVYTRYVLLHDKRVDRENVNGALDEYAPREGGFSFRLQWVPLLYFSRQSRAHADFISYFYRYVFRLWINRRPNRVTLNVVLDNNKNGGRPRSALTIYYLSKIGWFVVFSVDATIAVSHRCINSFTLVYFVYKTS